MFILFFFSENNIENADSLCQLGNLPKIITMTYNLKLFLKYFKK